MNTGLRTRKATRWHKNLTRTLNVAVPLVQALNECRPILHEAIYGRPVDPKKEDPFPLWGVGNTWAALERANPATIAKVTATMTALGMVGKPRNSSTCPRAILLPSLHVFAVLAEERRNQELRLEDEDHHYFQGIERDETDDILPIFHELQRANDYACAELDDDPFFDGRSSAERFLLRLWRDCPGALSRLRLCGHKPCRRFFLDKSPGGLSFYCKPSHRAMAHKHKRERPEIRMIRHRIEEVLEEAVRAAGIPAGPIPVRIRRLFRKFSENCTYLSIAKMRSEILAHEKGVPVDELLPLSPDDKSVLNWVETQCKAPLAQLEAGMRSRRNSIGPPAGT